MRNQQFDYEKEHKQNKKEFSKNKQCKDARKRTGTSC